MSWQSTAIYVHVEPVSVQHVKQDWGNVYFYHWVANQYGILSLSNCHWSSRIIRHYDYDTLRASKIGHKFKIRCHNNKTFPYFVPESSNTMSPLTEYLQDNDESYQPALADASITFERPQRHAMKLLRDRRRAMQASVAQFESIFESSTVADAVHETSAPTRKETPPAASSEAIMRLPKARVYPWDRESSKECSKTCGVCCDRLVDGVVVTRLPCGHVYHLYCVVPWLSKTCTCPECRYEIETKNPRFEVGRKQRMKDRATVTCSCKGTHTCFFPSPANDSQWTWIWYMGLCTNIIYKYK
jgi:hypothetical protein